MSKNTMANYFDYAASAPPWPEALEAYSNTARTCFANPSSVHSPGTDARNRVLSLKKECCDMMRFLDGRLLICSSASEANTTIIEGHMGRHSKARLLIAQDVHDSIWYATKKHSKAIRILPITKDGAMDPEHFEKAIRDNITMVCLSHICHETGAVHPIKELTEICHRAQVKVLIDGAQSIGHLPVDMNEVPFTYYSFSGHKFGAPKGTGGVFIRDGEFEPLVQGGMQQWGLRAGTEDIAGLSALKEALRISLSVMEFESKRLNVLRQYIISELTKSPRVVTNRPEQGFSGVLSCSIKGMSGRELVGALSIAGFALSTGSACQANQIEPSRILLAMGKSTEAATGCIRISMGPATTEEAVKRLVITIHELIK